MKILGIDPGNKISGYVIFNGKSVLKHGNVSNFELLKIIENNANKIDCLIIEKIQHLGKNFAVGETVFDTCIWIGRFTQLAMILKIKTTLINRKTIVVHHTGKATGNDSKVSKAVLTKYPKGTVRQPGVSYGITSHAIQALAAASFYFENYGK